MLLKMRYVINKSVKMSERNSAEFDPDLAKTQAAQPDSKTMRVDLPV